MPIAVAGSIATDHLMQFPGRFSEQLLPDQLHRVSLSFLVDDLVIRRGGVAANICYGMGLLGVRPILVGAVGADFDPYRQWLVDAGVDCSHVLTCLDVQTARFVCTTDAEMNQIATFYAGAMARSREIDVAALAQSVGGLDLLLIGADDPDGMVRHSQTARAAGITFAADPSQQLARMDGEQVVELLTGASLLFTNDYELGLLRSKTGWSTERITETTGTRVTTLGAHGVEIVHADGSVLRVAALPEVEKVDPTGVGDAFRAGYLGGRHRGLSEERSAQLGSYLATLVLESIGTQEYALDTVSAQVRLADGYGADAAAEIAGAMGWPHPATHTAEPVGAVSAAGWYVNRSPLV